MGLTFVMGVLAGALGVVAVEIVIVVVLACWALMDPETSGG